MEHIYSESFTDVSQYVLGMKEIEHLFPDAIRVDTTLKHDTIDPERKKIHDLFEKISIQSNN
jgi:hypothetical protein